MKFLHFGIECLAVWNLLLLDNVLIGISSTDVLFAIDELGVRASNSSTLKRQKRLTYKLSPDGVCKAVTLTGSGRIGLNDSDVGIKQL